MAPQPADHRTALEGAINENRHRRPTGHLMTPHEVNVAFSDDLMSQGEGITVEPGLASAVALNGA